MHTLIYYIYCGRRRIGTHFLASLSSSLVACPRPLLPLPVGIMATLPAYALPPTMEAASSADEEEAAETPSDPPAADDDDEEEDDVPSPPSPAEADCCCCMAMGLPCASTATSAVPLGRISPARAQQESRENENRALALDAAMQ